MPRLPGCWSQGSTEEAATQNLQEGIQEHLAARDDLLEGAVVREVEVASQNVPRNPGINHQEAVQAPQKTGFRVVGQGKHIVMSDGVRLVTIPRHNPVEPALPRVLRGRFVTVDWAPSNVGMQPTPRAPADTARRAQRGGSRW